MISVRLGGAISILAIVSACGSGGPSLSGSASEGSGSNSGFSSLWEKVRSLGFETGKTYEMPALGIMADAFMTDFAAREIDPGLLSRYMLERQRDEIPQFDLMIENLVEPTRAEIRSQDPAAISRITPLDADHMVYAAPIGIAMQARKGWQVQAIDDRRVDPAFDTPFFRAHRPPSRYDPDLHIRYMEMLAASAIYANTVFGLIDETIGNVRLSNPEAARREILEAFQKIPVTTLHAALQDAVGTMVEGRFSTDLTGSGNIHFTHAPAGDFVADARGITWTKAGGTWFGDGRISGQNINLRLASTSAVSQRQAQTGNQGTDANAGVEGSGKIGAGQ